MEARLKAILEMDASQLNKELADIGKEMGEFEKELSKAKDTSEIESITAKIAQLEKAMSLVIATMNKVGSGMSDIGSRVAKVEKDFSSTNTGTDVLAESMMQLDASVNRVAVKLDLLTPSISKIGSTAATTASNVSSVAVSSAKAAKATEAVGGAMKASTMTGQNFARVIQDLPFGFMGIQNNLTQLIPGIGAAGIAFSALTAAITFSQVGLSYWSKGAKDAKASISDLSEFTKEFTKNAAEEGVKARLLYEASNNVTISMDKRIRAAKELKDMYPDILNNYSAEDIALGKAKKGYDDLTASILQNAKAQAAKNRITELEAEIQNRQFNIQKIQSITDKQSREAQPTVYVGDRGANSKLVTIEEKRLDIQLRRNKAIADEKKEIDKLRASQEFFMSLAGGSTAVQQSIIPAPTKEKVAKVAKDVQKVEKFETPANKGKWWRESQTVSTGNTQIADPTVKRIEENATLNKILFEQAQAQMMVNDQLAAMSEIAEYGGQVFGQMVAAMMNGESIGDVLANAFKQIAVQIAAAVAQALIFAALLEAFPALKGVFATTGALAGNGGGGGGLLGKIQGQDIQISQRRTSTGMGFRRGRR